MGLHQRFSFSLHRARRVSFSLAPQEKKKWGRILTFKKQVRRILSINGVMRCARVQCNLFFRKRYGPLFFFRGPKKEEHPWVEKKKGPLYQTCH